MWVSGLTLWTDRICALVFSEYFTECAWYVENDVASLLLTQSHVAPLHKLYLKEKTSLVQRPTR